MLRPIKATLSGIMFLFLLATSSQSLQAQLRIDPGSIANLPDTVQFGDTLNNLSVNVVNDGLLPVANLLLEIKGGVNSLSNIITFGDTLLAGPVVINPGDSITIPLDQFIVSPQNSNNGSNVIIVWPATPNESGDTIEDEYEVEETTTSLFEALAARAELKIWPNPVQDELHYSTGDPATPIREIRVMDLQGRIIMAFDGSPRSVNTSSLITGMYLVEAVDRKGRRYTKRFMKQ